MYYSPNKRLHYRLGDQQKSEPSSSACNLSAILCGISALFALIAAVAGVARK